MAAAVEGRVTAARLAAAAEARGGLGYAKQRTVEPFIRWASQRAAAYLERRDLFLCDARDDRDGSAKEFYDHLKSNGASVWFSEEDLPLGSLMIRKIDKGLRNSRVGILLVTPSLLRSIEAEGVAETELAVLLSTRRVIPVLHGVAFDELNNVSPVLASHAGLSTKDSTLDNVAAKVAASGAALPAAEPEQTQAADGDVVEFRFNV